MGYLICCNSWALLSIPTWDEEHISVHESASSRELHRGRAAVLDGPIGYQISAPIYESKASLIYRATRESDDRSVVLKVPKAQSLSPHELTRYRREFDILRRLTVAGVIQVHGMEFVHGTPILVIEDFGAESLARLRRTRNGSPSALPQLGPHLDPHLGPHLGPHDGQHIDNNAHVETCVPAPTSHYHGQSNGQNRDLADILALAIRIVRILEQIHQRGFIHGDLTPANILLNPETDELKLCDFSCSSWLSRTSLPDISPHRIEGTLAYISPEQTGRMNRIVDYRSDFYTLGVTLYELLTGQLPFVCTDPMELIHAHLARQPVPISEHCPHLDPQVSAIVARLMAKTAESRYQSAWGIEYDLRTCLDQLRNEGKIDTFVLASNDRSDRFRLPQKLYGRDREIEALFAACDRATAGKAELMLVAGSPGIGKSALVKELYAPITGRRGYFVEGKFDQYQRNIPYSALTQAFVSLVEQILTEPDEELVTWQHALRAAVGPNGQVIVDVIAEVEHLIGPQSPVQDLGPTESKNRFNRVFQDFLRVFCASNHPLVIFLDDLQWADSASLDVLTLMLTEPTIDHLFVIGAYRDNEINTSHAIVQTVATIRAAEVPVHTVSLAPLSTNHVATLLADTLYRPPKACRPLAELVVAKTNGNPFFVNQFLYTLEQEYLLTFHPERQHWTWDLPAIRALDITDNVVDLMLRRIGHLTEASQHTLRMAACMGNTFALAPLATVCEDDIMSTHQCLVPAIELGLLVPLTEIEEGLLTSKEKRRVPSHEDTLVFANLRFLHDRVQQAAYSLIPKADRPAAHLRIGRLRMRALCESDREAEIFDLARHFSVGASLIEDDDERIAVAQIELEAARRAKATMANETARDYLRTGLRLMPVNAWEQHYELQFSLSLLMVEVSLLLADYDHAHALADDIRSHARHLLDKVQVYELQIIFHIAQNRMGKAIDTALDILDQLGLSLPRDAASIAARESQLRSEIADLQTDLAALDQQRELADRHQEAILRILVSVTSASYIGNPALFRLISTEAALLCIRHGHSAMAASAYLWYAALLCGSYREFEHGYRMGALAMRILERFPSAKFATKARNMFCTFILPWKRPIRESLPKLQEAVQCGLENGDFEYGLYASIQFTTYRLFFGNDSLDKVHRDQELYLGIIERYQLAFHRDFASIWQQIAQNLMGKNQAPTQLVGHAIDIDSHMTRWKEQNNFTLLISAYIGKTVVAYIFGDYADALRSARAGQPYCAGLAGTIYGEKYVFFHSLAALACFADSDEAERRVISAEVEENQQTLALWSTHAPENFSPQYHLIEAERAGTTGDVTRAMEEYDRALDLSRKNQHVLLQAFCHERAAAFYNRLGRRAIERMYLGNAYHTYMQSGFAGKQRQLEQLYPWLIATLHMSDIQNAPIDVAGTSNSINTEHIHESATNMSTTTLDFRSVVAASQAISSHFVLADLLAILMKIIIENAGAQRGYLLLNHEGFLTIEAEGDSQCDLYRLLPSIAFARQPAHGSTYKQVGTCVDDLNLDNGSNLLSLSPSMVHFVARTQKHALWPEPQQPESSDPQNRFAHDDYLAQNQPQSVLCAPIVHKGALVGIVYLENRAIRGAFSPARVEVVQVLAAQAAISIDNARLLENLRHSKVELECKVSERTHDLSVAKEDAERANRAKSDFLASINHELRTPMNGIIGALELLLPSEHDSQRRQYLEIAQTSADQLLRVINDTLDLSKIEAGKLTLNPTTFALDESLNSVTRMLSLPLKQRQLHYALHIDPNIPKHIVGDRDRLLQVLINLIGNAIKFTEPGGRIDLRADLEPHADTTTTNSSGYPLPPNSQLKLRFSVRDTGIGISPAAQKRIFETFTQADHTVFPNYGGSGLGLAISAQLVALMDGSIAVHSEVGQGSDFHFCAQFKTTSTPVVESEPAGAAAIEPSASQSELLPPLNILIAEDNPVNQLVATRLLERDGHHITIANNGLEAVRMASANIFDVIFMDMHMPEMDGFEATRHIRAGVQVEAPGLPQHRVAIIAMTAHSMASEVAKCLDAGMDGHLSKPVRIDDLRQILRPYREHKRDEYVP